MHPRLDGARTTVRVRWMLGDPLRMRGSRVNRRFVARLIIGTSLCGSLAMAGYVAAHRDQWFEKRVKVVVTGKLVRGAWQHPSPLRRIIAREGIKTIVTLTAINSTDPKFSDQARVVRETGIRWVIVPMRGSRATPEQLALAADLLADPANQPVFFHCVAGHHRTSLAHAAYLIRHRGLLGRGGLERDLEPSLVTARLTRRSQ